MSFSDSKHSTPLSIPAPNDEDTNEDGTTHQSSPNLSLTTKNSENSNTKKGKWAPPEDEKLRQCVELYGQSQWRKVSQEIPGRTSLQCFNRWTKILKPGLVKGPWTSEEDAMLLDWVRKHGPTQWAKAGEHIRGRNEKQCRERWFNSLNPDIKKERWSAEEDKLIFELYQQFGSSWSKISKYLEGRSENAVKNRFYSTQRRLMRAEKRDVGKSSVEEFSKAGEKIQEEEFQKENEESLIEQKLNIENSVTKDVAESKVQNKLPADRKFSMPHGDVRPSKMTNNLCGSAIGGHNAKGNTVKVEDFEQKMVAGEVCGQGKNGFKFDESKLKEPLKNNLGQQLPSEISLLKKRAGFENLLGLNKLDNIQKKIFSYCEKSRQTISHPVADQHNEKKQKTLSLGLGDLLDLPHFNLDQSFLPSTARSSLCDESLLMKNMLLSPFLTYNSQATPFASTEQLEFLLQRQKAINNLPFMNPLFSGLNFTQPLVQQANSFFNHPSLLSSLKSNSPTVVQQQQQQIPSFADSTTNVLMQVEETVNMTSHLYHSYIKSNLDLCHNSQPTSLGEKQNTVSQLYKTLSTLEAAVKSSKLVLNRLQKGPSQSEAQKV